MPRRIENGTPKEHGFFMPAEFSRQKRIFMMWPYRSDIWRSDGAFAQQAYARVADAISAFEEVFLFAPEEQLANCRKLLPGAVRVHKLDYNDAWARDIGPTFLLNNQGSLRAVDWTFNAWGGEVDGLHAHWELDDQAAWEFCKVANADSYRAEGFVLEGGSIHTDGEGTVLTTQMCLLSQGRNPRLNKAQIEKKLCDYLGCEKVLWLKDGIDPQETNGHVDDVACFTAPGEVACIHTEDQHDPFYQTAKDCYETLCLMTDAKGRPLKVHKICTTKKPVYLPVDFSLIPSGNAKKRKPGELCIASYLNFLIVNGGVIVPQYDDEHDALALEQVQALFPDRKVVGVPTREIVYGGGNIHCITQQQPASKEEEA